MKSKGNTLPELQKMDGWNATFLLGRPIFRGELLVSRTLPKCPKDSGCNGLVIAESYTEVKLNDLRKLVESLLLLRLSLLPIVTMMVSSKYMRDGEAALNGSNLHWRCKIIGINCPRHGNVLGASPQCQPWQEQRPFLKDYTPEI